MKPRHARLVRHLYFGAQLGEAVKCSPVGRSYVGSGDDAHPSPTPDERFDVLIENPDAVPLDERTQQVDAIGRGELLLNLDTNPRLISSVDEESTDRERDFGPRREANRARDLG